MTGSGPGPPRGVRALDHTADVGIEVRAPSREALFDRAARGMLALIRGEDEPGEGGGDVEGCDEGMASAGDDEGAGAREPHAPSRTLELEAVDAPTLLARWLRELLYLHEAHGFDYAAAEFETLGEHRLRARVWGDTDPAPPVRELKGVTYHGLVAERVAGAAWRARVIFDV